MTLQQKLRALGHQLAEAELYGFNIPQPLDAKHDYMLKVFYNLKRRKY